MRLGKHQHVADDRTMMLGNFMSPTLVIPPFYDFDKSRVPFPFSPWGNMEWGNCVVAGRTNHLLRLERVEQRRTLRISDGDVIAEYKHLCQEAYGHAPQEPEDEYDRGLNVLSALKSWRNEGWQLKLRVGKGVDKYSIFAYGELDPNEIDQLHSAIFLLHGIQLGFWLPKAVMGNLTLWDYRGENGDLWRPGGWGGHLVYAKAYTQDAVEIISWGRRIPVTPSFIAKYCDEAWAVVDDIDVWRKRPEIDVQGMLNHLREIGATLAP